MHLCILPSDNIMNLYLGWLYKNGVYNTYNIILTTACCSVYMVCHKNNNEVDVINFVAISQFVVLIGVIVVKGLPGIKQSCCSWSYDIITIELEIDNKLLGGRYISNQSGSAV